MATQANINLIKPGGVSQPLPVGNSGSVSVTILGSSLGTAKVELQYSPDYKVTDLATGGDDGTWYSYPTPIYLGAGKAYFIDAPVYGTGLRLKVITTDATADPNAVVLWQISNRSIEQPLNRKQLGQSRPSGTTAESIYSPAVGVRAEIEGLLVCNTSGAMTTFSLFLDDDGSTYDQTTALYYDVKIAAGSSYPIEPTKPWSMSDPLGNLAVKTGVANALTFTVWGVEQ